ncbi:hypothetical protein INT44_006118 [Umbelopsis vinacea]|uniref:Zn(2)-C6 fungal-type domain-containing protein n=1 Tax=Umbelopsis vinacea TaxID=44442 RepID=A0A8H7PDX3_9FUNG|nr:hypothetical protein INT44_006118 [Umbelopsis vinacea]
MKKAAKCDKEKGTKRSTLACLSCRSARQKCNGKPPEGLLDQHNVQSIGSSPVKSLQPCKRCIINQHDCLWSQSKRHGRPRNSQRIARIQSSRALQAYPASTVPTESYDAPNFTSDENLINPTDVLSLMQTDVDTLFGFEQGVMIPEGSSSMTLDDSSWFPMVDEGFLHMQEDTAVSQQMTEYISSGETTRNSVAPSTSPSSFASSILTSSEGTGERKVDKMDETVLHGFQRYFDLSFDPPPMISGGTTEVQRAFSELSETRSLGERALYLAMAASGYRMAKENLTLADSLFENGYKSIQQYFSNSDSDGPDISSAVDAMYAIQACTVLVPYAYGTRNASKAEELLLEAAQLAIRRELHRLDSPESCQDNISFRAQALELQNMMGERTGCSCRQFVSCPACFAEALRQTWWEKNSLTNEIWQFRIRCAAILVETLSVKQAQGSATKARLQALDTMISNLQKALHGSDHTLITKHETESRIRLHSMIIASELMLYGAQIHLHRLRWIPSFNLKLRACSFNVLDNADCREETLHEMPGTNTCQSIIYELENETEYELARQSLATIHSVSKQTVCANKIFKLIPNEAEEGCENLGQNSNSLTAHLPMTTFHLWPYFACVQVIAAFGQLIGMTAHRRSASCRPSNSHISEKAPGICLDSQCTPEELIAFPHKGEDKFLPVKWLRLEVCSNLQLAESMLTCMEDSWPFAEKCKDEVEACRTTIQGIGGITGLEYSL